MNDLFNGDIPQPFDYDNEKNTHTSTKKYTIFNQEGLLNRGKYKGKEIYEVPEYYRTYILKTWDLTEADQQAIETENVEIKRNEEVKRNLKKEMKISQDSNIKSEWDGWDDKFDF